MNLLDLRHKLEKGKSLGGEVVYIKDENIICGVGAIYKNNEEKSITLLKSKEESVKVDMFLDILNEVYATVGDGEVLVGNDKQVRDSSREIKSVEFAQYEMIKMLFINV
ncbi:hypothetical protein [Romboutsia sp.]|uniref:hypothetical protein n=1 Tax=Romboutsia sp. TaxID=1965302 RepID=UPI003F2C4FB9